VLIERLPGPGGVKARRADELTDRNGSQNMQHMLRDEFRSCGILKNCSSYNRPIHARAAPTVSMGADLHDTRVVQHLHTVGFLESSAGGSAMTIEVRPSCKTAVLLDHSSVSVRCRSCSSSTRISGSAASSGQREQLALA